MSILDDFSKKKRTAVPYKGFGNEDELLRNLSDRKYVMMTAQNPRKTPTKGPFRGEPLTQPVKEPPTSEKNIMALRNLMADLDARNLYYTTNIGEWGGTPEFSLIVWAPDDKSEKDFFLETYELSQQYGQQSIITSEPDIKTVIDPDHQGDPDVMRELKTREAPNPEEFTNVTPHGKELEEMTGRLEPDFDFGEGKPYASQEDESLYWYFEPLDWEELTPQQKASVRERMEAIRSA